MIEGRTFYGFPQEVEVLYINGEPLEISDTGNIFLIDKSTDYLKEYSLEIRTNIKFEMFEKIVNDLKSKNISTLFIKVKSGKTFVTDAFAESIEWESSNKVGERYIKLDYMLTGSMEKIK